MYSVSVSVTVGVPLIVSRPTPWFVSTRPAGKAGLTLSVLLLYSIGISVNALPRQSTCGVVTVASIVTVSFTSIVIVLVLLVTPQLLLLVADTV